jgi:hypothetical protein
MSDVVVKDAFFAPSVSNCRFLNAERAWGIRKAMDALPTQAYRIIYIDLNTCSIIPSIPSSGLLIFVDNSQSHICMKKS